MKQVTVLIPNYKTLQLTKLCLRLIRKYTDLNKIEVIVIDNDSQDDSTEYLKSLSWIKLIERPAVPGEHGALAHSRALDLALEQVTTPYVLSIHTDTLVKKSGWLEYLINCFDNNPNIAGVGSWKLESKPFVKQLLKDIEDFCKKNYYKLIGSDQHHIAGLGNNQYYLRSHCAMYRTELVKKHGLKFTSHDTAGKDLHLSLEKLGYHMKFIDSKKLLQYVEHVNHATVLLTDLIKDSRSQNKSSKVKRLQKIFAAADFQQVLADDGLDD